VPQYGYEAHALQSEYTVKVVNRGQSDARWEWEIYRKGSAAPRPAPRRKFRVDDHCNGTWKGGPSRIPGSPRPRTRYLSSRAMIGVSLPATRSASNARSRTSLARSSGDIPGPALGGGDLVIGEAQCQYFARTQTVPELLQPRLRSKICVMRRGLPRSSLTANLR
jgi:hypothetical protein